MESFYQFWDKINGEPYKNVPPPVQYDLADYGQQITSNPINTEKDGVWELTPLAHDDMCRYAANDVEEWYAKHGRNTTSLGSEMSDEEFKKYQGL